MELSTVLSTIIEPAYALLPSNMDSKEARVLQLAIGLQESRFETRDQIDPPGRNIIGPALSFWQMEQGGGVRGVLNHPASRQLAINICRQRGVSTVEKSVWLALRTDDILGACFARLLLWTDPRPLPAIGEVQKGWEYYVRNWRPGRPHPETWPGLYQKAQEAVA